MAWKKNTNWNQSYYHVVGYSKLVFGFSGEKSSFKSIFIIYFFSLSSLKYVYSDDGKTIHFMHKNMATILSLI